MRFKVSVLALGVLALVSSSALAADGPNAAAAFERLKGLVGEWEAVQANGQKATSRFEVIAGGSALLERETGMGSEMITLYHLDGDRLLLTHYCMAGNQPRMRLTAFDPATGELAFEFLDATGLPNPAAGHMRRARFWLEAANRYSTQWNFVENGKSTFDEKFKFARMGSGK